MTSWMRGFGLPMLVVLPATAPPAATDFRADASAHAAECGSLLSSGELAGVLTMMAKRLPLGTSRAAPRRSGLAASPMLISLGGLRSGRRDIVAYSTDPRYCGSAGCTMLVIADNRARRSSAPSYGFVSRLIGVKLPVVALPAVHNGWHDLSFIAAGGGNVGASAVLSFDEHGYSRTSGKLRASGIPLQDYRLLIGRNPVGDQQCRVG